MSWCEQLSGKFGYSNNPMNPPPAEKGDNVIQFALTEGCSHNACTFCVMYREGDNNRKKQFHVKTPREFGDHVEQVLHNFYVQNPAVLSGFNRIFIGAGNALGVDHDLLLQATQYALLRLKDFTAEIPRRLAVYGNTNDILEHGYSDLRHLRCGGVCGNCSIDRLGSKRGVDVVYWGVESANDLALQIGGKGYTQEMALQAGDLLKRADIRPSIMIMPGLGGMDCWDGHVEDTVYLLNRIRPEWVTFIGLRINEGTPYDRWIKKEEARGTNRRLTEAEIIEQTAQMVERLNFETTIGVHGSTIHTFGDNPAPIGAHKVGYVGDSRRVARLLRREAEQNGLRI